MFGPAVTMAFMALIAFGRHFLGTAANSVIGRIMSFTIGMNALMFAVLTIHPAGYLFTGLMIANMPAELLMLMYAASLWIRRVHTG